MQRQKYTLSRPGSLYATKRGHALTTTQPESFPKPVNSTGRQITTQKSRSAPMPRQDLGGSLVIGSKQSVRITLDANPSVSPWFEQFP
jgi:hypothetical protein